MKINTFTPRFVEFIPRAIQDGVLYISIEYATATHKCACGCGLEVVTPLTPNDWKLIYDGTVTLNPSIGNWSYKCQSHYWIISNRVQWSRKWTQGEIDAGRAQDIQRKQKHYKDTVPAERTVTQSEKALSLWQTVKSWFKSS